MILSAVYTIPPRKHKLEAPAGLEPSIADVKNRFPNL